MRIESDVSPGTGQRNSLGTFSTGPALSESSIAFGKVSAATNEALGTSMNISHPPRFKKGGDHGRSKSRNPPPDSSLWDQISKVHSGTCCPPGKTLSGCWQ